MHEGLTTREAAKRLDRFGSNEIVDKPRQHPIQILLAQFTSLLVVLLIIASLASLFLGDLLDGIFILLIVLLNGILGFVQEYKAEKAIAALKTMTVSSIRLVRDGIEQKIDSKLLVPGDIILLAEGDKIPADCVVLESVHLTANEASLTGESMPVEKNSTDDDKKQLFLGTIVTKGRGVAKVTATGMQTRFGQIAGSLASIVEEDTPLEKKLSTLGKQLGILALLASAVVFFIGYLEKQPFIEMMLTSISLAVAAVPEGLPAVITITLAIGMQRMARKKALVRRLASIETLGSTTIIATDKTGTLTKNEMRVTDVWFGDKSKHAHDKTLQESDPLFHELLTIGIHCNNASLVVKENHAGFDTLGDTTEAAILLLAADKGVHIEEFKESGTLIEEFGFDAVLKMMSVVWREGKQTSILTKGAPEAVLSRSTSLLDASGVKVITPKLRGEIEAAFEAYAREGLRVIAFAKRSVRVAPKSRESAENDLTFIGFVGIADPPREEVKDAIAIAEAAGIRTIMVTGDNELTAKTIGTRLGLLQKNEEVITGAQFAAMTDDEALRRMPSIRIFARTTPEQKLRIVQLLQRAGHIVAVTGDGVNDSLALKQSDIGISMGITGTDVAKEASDMIISDDNYATIVTAVEEGRTIFDNIKSAIKYLVGCNIGEVFAVVIGMLLGWPLILTPLQLLYINLVTDGLPAIALAVTPKHDRIMKRMPRTKKNIFDRMDFVWIIEVSLLTAATTLIASYIGQKTGTLVLSRAFAFTTIILVQHFILLDLWVRDRSFWHGKIFTDKVFRIAFFVPLLLQGALLYIPSIANIFKVTGFTAGELMIIILLSSVVLVASEIRKYFLNRLPVAGRH